MHIHSWMIVIVNYYENVFLKASIELSSGRFSSVLTILVMRNAGLRYFIAMSRERTLSLFNHCARCFSVKALLQLGSKVDKDTVMLAAKLGKDEVRHVRPFGYVALWLLCIIPFSMT